ncbi:hypothetical protein HMPREF9999_00226 [Alloprevotella sp. oral taxon 473 str. F0040]|nr:hypothetical protein HMPREF9999_00226 [Alloprevotella sp. oral taxon 473 str. F0040]
MRARIARARAFLPLSKRSSLERFLTLSGKSPIFEKLSPRVF